MASVWLEWNVYAPAECLRGAVSIGNFDGVHLGHRALLAAAKAQAARFAGPVVAVTFDPPPFQVLHPDSGPPRPPLTTLTQRSKLLHAAGADHVIILRTEPALLALSPEAFFEDILLRQLVAKAIVEGYDFHFGRGRQGTNTQLRQLCLNAGLAFEEVPPVAIGCEAVSSSRVRRAIEQGDVRFAQELLGHRHAIRGQVVEGARRGRAIGFPTANLANVDTLLPAEGVYAVVALHTGKRYLAAANIGPNPTFGEQARKIEIHLLDFQGDLYGQELEVEFVARIRETRPFENAAQLIEQLQRDVAESRRILDNELPTRS